MRFVMALLTALLSIATAPLRMLGIGGPAMTPASIAAAAMEAGLDEGGDDEAEAHPLGELIRAWVTKWLSDERTGSR